MINRIILIILLAALPLCATTTLDHPLTIAELVDIALENNPSTKQAWWNANRAAAALGSAKSDYYPSVDFDTFVENGRTFRFINGPDTNYTIVGADLILNMLLWDYGARSANVEGAKMALLAANWQTDWAIQKVFVKVLENAYSTLHSQEVVKAYISSLGDAEMVLRTAQETNHAGLTPVSDVYTARTNLAVMRMDVTQQTAQLDIQKGKLSISLGLPANTSVELACLDELTICQSDDVDELIALAMKQRGDLIAKQARLCESFAKYEKASKMYAPKLSFNASGGANHFLHDKANSAQYSVGLNLDVPLFTGFDATYQTRMAYADMQISTEQLAELQLDITLEVLTYSRTVQAAQDMFCDAQLNLDSAQKAYEGTLERYKAGKDRITDVSFAQRQLAQARVRYSEVKTKWLVSIANLAYATGTLAPYMEKP